MGRKKITHKKCPVCKITKARDQYYEYWSKARGAYRIDSRCKSCSYDYCKPARKKWFIKNREFAIQRMLEWGKANEEKMKQYQYEFNKNCVKEAKGGYLNKLFKRYTGLEPKENPELVKAYKNQLLIKRKLNEKHTTRLKQPLNVSNGKIGR